MTPNSYYDRVIRGEARGVMAAGFRAVLSGLSLPYRGIIRVRNAYYDGLPHTARRAGVPVISVGNVVTGGTGKTPMVIYILERLLEAGRRPCVLTRGYKAKASGCCSENDEAREIRRRCPRVDLVIDPDRVAGAAKALGLGSDVLVMDDGFQHRRLARDLDIVLIDATNPFGGGMLPRGHGREPETSLARADVVVVTRADQIEAGALASLRGRLERLAPGRPVLAARHRPIELCDVSGRTDSSMPVEACDGQRAWVFAGLGNPRAFRATVEAMGLNIVGEHFWPDHHTWSDAEMDAMAREAGRAKPDVVLTTEKDAVKLPPDAVGLAPDAAKLALGRPSWPVPVRVVRIGIEFLDDGAEILRQRIEEVLGRGEEPVTRED
jgi:tetraacyldisaccharide 4'-kinase